MGVFIVSLVNHSRPPVGLDYGSSDTGAWVSHFSQKRQEYNAQERPVWKSENLGSSCGLEIRIY